MVKFAYEPSGLLGRSLSRFLLREATSSISTPTWTGCYSMAGLPPALNSPVPIYKPGLREALWELSVLPKNITQCPRPGLEPGPLDPETSPLTHEGTAPWDHEATACRRRGQQTFCGCSRFRFVVRVIYITAVFIKSFIQSCALKKAVLQKHRYATNLRITALVSQLISSHYDLKHLVQRRMFQNTTLCFCSFATSLFRALV